MNTSQKISIIIWDPKNSKGSKPFINTLKISKDTPMSSILDLYRKIEEGKRINSQEAWQLFKEGDLLTLGRFADTLNKKKNGTTVGYVIDRNINYTNVCVLRCKFCAFRR